jgi:predicted RNA-binding protein YlqC (UPF0109 family)
VRLLVDHRDDLVVERTRLQSRIRWHLHDLSPELEIRSRGLRSERVVAMVAEHLAGRAGLVAQIATEILDRIRELNVRVKELEKAITRLVIRLAPSLLDIPAAAN